MKELTIEEIIPHRPPFLLVSKIDEYTLGKDFANLKAHYIVNLRELSLEKLIKLPSSYILEGLGQCCNIISVLNERNEISKDENSINDMTFNNSAILGLLANVDIELYDEVDDNSIISYEVIQSFSQANFSIFEVQAFCNETTIAKGKLIGSKKHFNAGYNVK